MKIMIIGLMDKQFLPQTIAEEFESIGHDVVRIASDTSKITEKFDYHIIDEMVKKNINKAADCTRQSVSVNVVKLVDKFKPDYIFLQQNHLCYDFNGVSTPLFYYQTQSIKLWVPTTPNLVGIFHAGIGSERQIQIEYPLIHYRLEKYGFIDLVPWGWNNVIYDMPSDNWFDRAHDFGFMGTTSIDGGSHSNNFMETHCYYERNKYLGFLEKQKKLIPEIIRGRRTTDIYKNFMKDLMVSINIPGCQGKVNQRQYHSIGMGCLLLQWEYPELRSLGFINGENCLTFNTKEQLVYQMNFISDYPYACKEIRDNGMKFIKNHTFKHRAKVIVDKIDNNKI